jgi:hypothetical protein
MRTILVGTIMLGWVLWVGDVRQDGMAWKVVQQYPEIQGQGMTAKQLCESVSFLIQARHAGRPRQFRCLPEGTRP